jgi:hypothetical protein
MQPEPLARQQRGEKHNQERPQKIDKSCLGGRRQPQRHHGLMNVRAILSAERSVR